VIESDILHNGIKEHNIDPSISRRNRSDTSIHTLHPDHIVGISESSERSQKFRSRGGPKIDPKRRGDSAIFEGLPHGLDTLREKTGWNCEAYSRVTRSPQGLSHTGARIYIINLGKDMEVYEIRQIYPDSRYLIIKSVAWPVNLVNFIRTLIGSSSPS
jgi:hypothetical protein